jgi:hypothetical protein
MTIRYYYNEIKNGGDEDPRDGETHGGQWNV